MNKSFTCGSPLAETPLTGAMPGGQPNGDDYYTDWQLSDRRRAFIRAALDNCRGLVTDWQLVAPNAVSAPARTIRRTLAALGTPVRDVNLHAKQVRRCGNTIIFEAAGAQFTVEFAGHAPAWGEKGVAKGDVSAFAGVPGAEVSNGGGEPNSVRELRRLCRDRGLSLDIHAISTTSASADLSAELHALGVRHTALGLAPMATNVVLTNGQIPPERLIAKSASSPGAALNREAALLDQALAPDLIALLVNSPKSDEVAAHAVARARSIGARIYTVLTNSLSVPLRLERLFSPEEANVCNQAEFCELASALGIDCPTEEKRSNVGALVKAISQLAHIKPCGDLVVTMGEAGCVVGDATTGVSVHVSLTDRARDRVRGSARADKINGSGDRFAAVFTLEHALFRGASAENSRALYAARQASLEVVRSYSPMLRPDRNWFGVRIFTERFGR